MLNRVGFVDYVLFICLFELFNLFEVVLESFPLLNVVFNIFLDFTLLNRKFFKLFFQKVGKLFLATMMFINEPLLDFAEHSVEFPH